jgi:DNA-binding transcriptional MocR family regulator
VEGTSVRRARPGHWIPDLRSDAKAVYLAIVDAIAADIQSGRLSTADRLPPQRELAKALDVNYATVSRAYGEAQRRGLVYSRVGQGTFVRKPRPSARPRSSGGRVDMTMNLPPEPEDPLLVERLEGGFRRLSGELRELLRYQEFGGSSEARHAAASWLARVGLTAEVERLLVCPGAQSALVATLNSLANPGDVALCENLTYPGIRAVAAQLGVRLIGLPMDREGISSDAFAAACAEHRPKVLYCNPTMQNPTTATISGARLSAILRATTVMASPMMVALATHWVEDGTAEAVLLAIRAESVQRQRLAAKILPEASFLAHPEGFHLWLSLPEPWKRVAFASHMRSLDVHVVVSDAFAVEHETPEAVRVCLGGEPSRSQVKRALEAIADALQQPASREAAFF